MVLIRNWGRLHAERLSRVWLKSGETLLPPAQLALAWSSDSVASRVKAKTLETFCMSPSAFPTLDGASRRLGRLDSPARREGKLRNSFADLQAKSPNLMCTSGRSSDALSQRCYRRTILIALIRKTRSRKLG